MSDYTLASIEPSETSYFSAPSEDLDPVLFVDMRLRPNVRNWILSTLYSAWGQHLKGVPDWATTWIAGSGASYQWAAAREPGDLDILIGVSYVSFRRANLSLAGLNDAEISQYLNDLSRQVLYPATAHEQINGKVFEVTWFVNPYATNITSINPYAAYDVTHDRWTVHPYHDAHAPQDQQWQVWAQRDADKGKQVVQRYNDALQAYLNAPNPAVRVNALTTLNNAVDQAVAMFDEIHLGRRQAFGPNGKGYSDWANYRWQAGKASGTIQALSKIRNSYSESKKERQTFLYGAPLDTADALVLRAMTHRRPQ